MKNYVIILIGVIIALVIVGGAVAYVSMENNSSNNDTIQGCIPNITNATNDNSTVVKTTTKTTTTNTSNNSSSGPEIVEEHIEFNAQQGYGYFREVTYSDGEFRQFDVDTGELIGSSYASDQDKLPSME